MANGEYNECKNKSCQFSIYFNQSKEEKCLHGCHRDGRGNESQFYFFGGKIMSMIGCLVLIVLCYTIKRAETIGCVVNTYAMGFDLLRRVHTANWAENTFCFRFRAHGSARWTICTHPLFSSTKIFNKYCSTWIVKKWRSVPCLDRLRRSDTWYAYASHSANNDDSIKCLRSINSLSLSLSSSLSLSFSPPSFFLSSQRKEDAAIVNSRRHSNSMLQQFERFDLEMASVLLCDENRFVRIRVE